MDLKYSSLAKYVTQPVSLQCLVDLAPIVQAFQINLGRILSMLVMPGIIAAYALRKEDRDKGMPMVDEDLGHGVNEFETYAPIPAVQYGVTGIYFSAVVSSWAAFETLATDLWVKAVNLRPHRLGRAAINGQAKREDDADGKDIGSGKNSTLRFIQSLIGDDDIELSRQIGDLIKQTKKFDFNRLVGIQDAYSCAFGQDAQALFAGFVGLDVLEGLRNLFVHRGGAADRMYRKRFKTNRAAYESFDLKLPEMDELVDIDGEVVSKAIDATKVASTLLIDYVSAWLRNNPSPTDAE